MRVIEAPLLPNSGLTTWHAAIHELKVERKLFAQVVREWNHNYRVPDDPLQVESMVATDDRLVFGSVNRSNEHFHSVSELVGQEVWRHDSSSFGIHISC